MSVLYCHKCDRSVDTDIEEMHNDVECLECHLNIEEDSQ